MSAFFLLLLAGCGSETTPAPTSAAEVPTESVASSTAPSAEVMAQWTRSCALCHVRGEGGAPVIGDREAWAPRLAQGEDILLQHTLEGLNNMPPLGYCMDCEETDFRQIIRFMGGDA